MARDVRMTRKVAMSLHHCVHCEQQLTRMEKVTHGWSCDECEQDWSRTLYWWRSGGENAELDEMFLTQGHIM